MRSSRSAAKRSAPQDSRPALCRSSSSGRSRAAKRRRRALARPGGNVTGVVILGPELDGKRLELLHEAVPGARRIAGLFVPGRVRDQSEREMRKVADSLGVELLPFDAEEPEDYARVFEAMRAAGVQGLVIMAHPDLFRDRDVLAKLALQAGLPTACEWSEMARAGCLLGYGPSAQELFAASGILRRAYF